MIIEDVENRAAESFLMDKKEIIVNSAITQHKIVVYSSCLKREVKVEVYLVDRNGRDPGDPLLLLNDGQEMKALGLTNTLGALRAGGHIPGMTAVAIHAGKNRHEEYGTAEYLDYKRRGRKAKSYSLFVTKELLPFLSEVYNISIEAARVGFAGFSLGGLSALDIAWRNPHLFSRTGVFSGSLWWRYKKPNPQTGEFHRIMHKIVRSSEKREGMKFWFQAGTKDEKHDRNRSGTIDAIEDTVDLIEELKRKGYGEEDIVFHLVKGGEHNFKTWSRIFPEFMLWAYGESTI
ncbi:MAG: alpha/beta hydrolase-fold protein [Balneolaceae bacterium]|nr:alpha/beta hydrolase-fold protein [Balneolaceae bacterium]